MRRRSQVNSQFGPRNLTANEVATSAMVVAVVIPSSPPPSTGGLFSFSPFSFSTTQVRYGGSLFGPNPDKRVNLKQMMQSRAGESGNLEEDDTELDQINSTPFTFTPANVRRFNIVDHFDIERPEMIPGSVVLHKPDSNDTDWHFHSPIVRTSGTDLTLEQLMDATFRDPRTEAEAEKEAAQGNHLSHAEYHQVQRDREVESVLRARTSASHRFLNDRLEELDDGVQPWAVVESVLPSVAQAWFPSEYSLGQPNPMDDAAAHKSAFSGGNGVGTSRNNSKEKEKEMAMERGSQGKRRTGGEPFLEEGPEPLISSVASSTAIKVRKMSFKERMAHKKEKKPTLTPSKSFACPPPAPITDAQPDPPQSTGRRRQKSESFVERPPWMLDAVAQIPGYEPKDFDRKMTMCVSGHTIVPDEVVPGTQRGGHQQKRMEEQKKKLKRGDSEQNEHLVPASVDVYALKRKRMLFDVSVAGSPTVEMESYLSGQLKCGTFSEYSQMFSDCAAMKFLDPCSTSATLGNAAVVATDTNSWGSTECKDASDSQLYFFSGKSPLSKEEEQPGSDALNHSEEPLALTTLWLGFTDAPLAGFPTVSAVNALDTEYGRQHIRPGFGCSVGLADVYYVGTPVGTVADRLRLGFKKFILDLSCAKELAATNTSQGQEGGGGVGGGGDYSLSVLETLREEEALDEAPVTLGGRSRAHRLPDQVSIPIRPLMATGNTSYDTPIRGGESSSSSSSFQFVSYWPHVVWLSLAYQVCQQMMAEHCIQNTQQQGEEKQRRPSSPKGKKVQLRSNTFFDTNTTRGGSDMSGSAYLRRKDLRSWCRESGQSLVSLEDEAIQRVVEQILGIAAPDRVLDWHQSAFLKGETFKTLTAIQRWEEWLKSPTSASGGVELQKARRSVALKLIANCRP